MRLKLLSCEVLYREMCHAVARSPHQVDVEFFEKGLHDLGGDRMRERLQQAVDATDPTRFDAILMGYALCGNGLHHLAATTLPLVVPRAHDCIALLMGSRERYQQYFDANPGVYFRSTGWLERGQGIAPAARNQTGGGYTLAELIEKYGDENGRYLYEQLHAYEQTYRQLTFIETGLEPNASFENRAREEAARRNWKYEKVRGDLGMFERLVSGDWDHDAFLVVPRGYRVAARYDSQIIDMEQYP